MELDKLIEEANKGYPVEQRMLGESYLFGTHGIKDIKKAIHWLTLAGDKGSMYAQCHLGLMYESGREVEINYTKAMEWYKKAFNQYSHEGAFGVARLYYRGRGVPKDREKAELIYNNIADYGADQEFS